ncbi:hypothetical protein [Enterococcus phage PEF1]
MSIEKFKFFSLCGRARFPVRFNPNHTFILTCIVYLVKH